MENDKILKWEKGKLNQLNLCNKELVFKIYKELPKLNRKVKLINRYFFEKDKQGQKRHIKICLTSISLRKCKLKLQYDLTLSLYKWLKWKLATTQILIRIQRKWIDLSYIANGQGKCTATLKKTWQCLSKLGI